MNLCCTKVILAISIFISYHGCIGYILRLPCKTESNFEVIIKGHRLTNHVIEQSTVNTVHECYERCENQNGCKSVNYREVGDSNCQLNKKFKESAFVNELEVSETWTYHSTNYSTVNIGSYCETFQPCQSTEFCMDTCTCPGYQCFRWQDAYKYNEDIIRHVPESCRNYYSEGHRSNGVYLLSGGEHYCLMEDVGCGSGGWTLAMKVKGDSHELYAESQYWTNDQPLNQLSPSILSDADEKYPAFNSASFNSICIGMKKLSTNVTKWLPMFNVSASSLKDIFASGDQKLTAVGINKWKALMDYPRMQDNCNLEGINLKSFNRIAIRIGYMANNEYQCDSSDSFIGAGITNYVSSVTAGNRAFSPVEHDPAMAYILIN